VSKAKKLISAAKEAAARGDDKEAISLFKKSLLYTNEKPEIEDIFLFYMRNFLK